MLRTAGDMLGDWVDRAPGWGVVVAMVLGGIVWSFAAMAFLAAV